MAELYVQYERSPYFDRQSGMTLEVIPIVLVLCVCVCVCVCVCLLACARSRCQVALQSVFCENAACQCISQQCCATGLHLWLLRLALIRPLMFQYGLLYLSSGISHSDRKVVLPLRRQSVLLHHRGTDLRLFQPRWRGKACCDGP